MGKALTSREAAKVLGVSESSVRRWCDRGTIRGQKTAGGHRRILESELLDFARQNGIRTRATNWQIGSERSSLSSAVALERCIAYGCAGETEILCELLVNLFTNQFSFPELCDQIVAPALAIVGKKWEAGQLDIYEEHQAVVAMTEATRRVGRLLRPVNPDAPGAITFALDNDVYRLAPMLSALCLQDAGFHAKTLGANLPVASAAKAIQVAKPKLVAISVSVADREARFLSSIQHVVEASHQAGAVVAVGGRALTVGARRELKADFFGDTLAHLKQFASLMLDRAAQRSA